MKHFFKASPIVAHDSDHAESKLSNSDTPQHWNATLPRVAHDSDHAEQTPNSAIKYPVTVGRSVTAPSVIATRDIAHVIECVKTGFFEGTDLRALIHTIRALPDPDLAREMKKSLPWFCGALCERFRSNATVKKARFMLFDLDHVPDIEALKAAAIEKLPFVRYAFRSVRDGVKLIAQLDRDLTREEDFRALWRYLALQVEKALAHPVDPAPDWARACFFSFDPGLLHNSGFRPVETASALKEARFVLELAHVAHDSGHAEQSPVNHVTPGGAAPPPQNAKTLKRQNVKTTSSQPLCDSALNEERFSEARAIVECLAQKVIPYSDWIRIGMALYSGFGEDGKELWQLFLANPHYRDTQRALDAHWRSFRRVRSISLETLFFLGGKYGCA